MRLPRTLSKVSSSYHIRITTGSLPYVQRSTDMCKPERTHTRWTPPGRETRSYHFHGQHRNRGNARRGLSMYLSNDHAGVVITASEGGRVDQITDLWSGRDLLVSLDKEPGPRTDYVSSSVGGWDSLFPNDETWQTYPDHGRVWTTPFTVHSHTEGSATLTATIDQPAAEITQRYDLLEAPRRGLRVSTLIRATSETGPFLWTAHPMLAVEEGWRVALSLGANRFRADLASPGRFQSGQTLGPRDVETMTTIPGPETSLCEIVYIEGTSEAVACSADGAAITRVAWDGDRLPYLWHTIITGCLGIDNCLLLEPSTSPSTKLGQAIISHAANALKTRQELRIWTEVESLDRVW